MNKKPLSATLASIQARLGISSKVSKRKVSRRRSSNTVLTTTAATRAKHRSCEFGIDINTAGHELNNRIIDWEDNTNTSTTIQEEDDGVVVIVVTDESLIETNSCHQKKLNEGHGFCFLSDSSTNSAIQSIFEVQHLLTDNTSTETNDDIEIIRNLSRLWNDLNYASTQKGDMVPNKATCNLEIFYAYGGYTIILGLLEKYSTKIHRSSSSERTTILILCLKIIGTASCCYSTSNGKHDDALRAHHSIFLSCAIRTIIHIMGAHPTHTKIQHLSLTALKSLTFNDMSFLESIMEQLT